LLDAAMGYIRKAEGCDCDTSRSSYLRGKIMLLMGDSAKAEKEFQKSLSADSLNALGTIYDERGDHRKAQVMYRRVILADSNYIDAYNNLGLSMLVSGNYSGAIKYLENACTLPESNVAYRSNLALAYGLSGNMKKAREIYAQDFDGDELEEKLSYVEDLLLSKRNEK
jgi:Flp pilus assembly protein TadD